MSDKKPTPAQKEALQFVQKHGPSQRPDDYHRSDHGVVVRRDVWERCHDMGWLQRPKEYWEPSELTAAGRAVLGKKDDP